MKQLMICPVLLSVIPCAAELTALSDSDLSAVDGAGLAYMLEDFAFASGSEIDGTLEIANLSGSIDGIAGEASLQVSRFYVAGSGSNRGQNVLGNGVDIGRLSSPYYIGLELGDQYRVLDNAVVTLETSERLSESLLTRNLETRTESASPGSPTATGQRIDSVTFDDSYQALAGNPSDWIDMGLVFDLDINGNATQSLQMHATGLNLDGTALRLWGRDNQLYGNLALNLYSNTLEFQACGAGVSAGASCGQSIVLSDFLIEGDIGYGDDQPIELSVTPDGQFRLTVGSIEGKSTAFYQEWYGQGPRLDVYVDNVQVGDTSFGSSTIGNLQVQYLDIRSRDL